MEALILILIVGIIGIWFGLDIRKGERWFRSPYFFKERGTLAIVGGIVLVIVALVAIIMQLSR